MGTCLLCLYPLHTSSPLFLSPLQHLCLPPRACPLPCLGRPGKAYTGKKELPYLCCGRRHHASLHTHTHLVHAGKEEEGGGRRVGGSGGGAWSMPLHAALFCLPLPCLCRKEGRRKFAISSSFCPLSSLPPAPFLPHTGSSPHPLCPSSSYHCLFIHTCMQLILVKTAGRRKGCHGLEGQTWLKEGRRAAPHLCLQAGHLPISHSVPASLALPSSLPSLFPLPLWEKWRRGQTTEQAMGIFVPAHPFCPRITQLPHCLFLTTSLPHEKTGGQGHLSLPYLCGAWRCMPVYKKKEPRKEGRGGGGRRRKEEEKEARCLSLPLSSFSPLTPASFATPLPPLLLFCLFLSTPRLFLFFLTLHLSAFTSCLSPLRFTSSFRLFCLSHSASCRAWAGGCLSLCLSQHLLPHLILSPLLPCTAGGGPACLGRRSGRGWKGWAGLGEDLTSFLISMPLSLKRAPLCMAPLCHVSSSLLIPLGILPLHTCPPLAC